MMNPTHALLILGMHRSGTSALTGALALRGVHLGSDLMPPAAENPKGFWEHLGVVNIHEQLFSALGHCWSSPDPLPEHWLLHPATETAREQLRTLIRSEFLPHPVWAVKDPRLCRLLPLWRPLLEELGVNASAVVIARDPREVAASLQKRNQWPPELARELWLRHLADAILGSHELPRCVLTYSRLLADPLSEIEAMVESLHLPLPMPEPAYINHLRAFVQAQDRHHHALSDIRPEWALTTSLYRQMLCQPVPWDALYTTAQANILTDTPLSRALAEYAQLHTKQYKALHQLQHKFNQTHQALEHTRQEFSQALTETQQALTQTQQALTETQQALTQTQQALTETQQALTQTQQALDDRCQRVQELESILQRILASRSWRWSKPLRGMTKLFRRQKPFSTIPAQTR